MYLRALSAIHASVVEGLVFLGFGPPLGDGGGADVFKLVEGGAVHSILCGGGRLATAHGSWLDSLLDGQRFPELTVGFEEDVLELLPILAPGRHMTSIEAMSRKVRTTPMSWSSGSMASWMRYSISRCI